MDLAVNMDVDGIHPKYSNRVPESWHPMDSVNWQPGQQNSPQPLKRWPVKVSDNGGTLLFSDSPEYVEEMVFSILMWWMVMAVFSIII